MRGRGSEMRLLSQKEKAKHLLVCCLLLAGAWLLASGLTAQPKPFQLEEATIASVHAAMKAKQLTCRQLVDAYLDRIAKFDKPAINAIVLTNPDARKEADALDRQFAQRGLTGP